MMGSKQRHFARLALLTPDLFHLAVERMARRHEWANVIQKKVEKGGAGNEQ